MKHYKTEIIIAIALVIVLSSIYYCIYLGLTSEPAERFVNTKIAEANLGELFLCIAFPLLLAVSSIGSTITRESKKIVEAIKDTND